jgi:hypothetical protein
MTDADSQAGGNAGATPKHSGDGVANDADILLALNRRSA